MRLNFKEMSEEQLWLACSYGIDLAKQAGNEIQRRKEIYREGKKELGMKKLSRSSNSNYGNP